MARLPHDRQPLQRAIEARDQARAHADGLRSQMDRAAQAADAAAERLDNASTAVGAAKQQLTLRIATAAASGAPVPHGDAALASARVEESSARDVLQSARDVLSQLEPRLLAAEEALKEAEEQCSRAVDQVLAQGAGALVGELKELQAQVLKRRIWLHYLLRAMTAPNNGFHTEQSREISNFLGESWLQPEFSCELQHDLLAPWHAVRQALLKDPAARLPEP
jgi:hypothetical protein